MHTHARTCTHTDTYREIHTHRNTHTCTHTYTHTHTETQWTYKLISPLEKLSLRKLSSIESFLKDGQDRLCVWWGAQEICSRLGVWGSPAVLPRSAGKLGSVSFPLCQALSTQGQMGMMGVITTPVLGHLDEEMQVLRMPGKCLP